MSVLARVLQKYGTPIQRGDKSVTNPPERPSVAFGTPSDGHSLIFAALRPRLIRMADRWRYAPDELDELLELAQRDPVKWQLAVELDEAREAEFRAAGLLV